MHVDCNACGASMHVDETTHFATCAKCTTRLEIKRNDGAVYSVVREEQEAHPPSTHAPAPPPPGVNPHSESILRVLLGGMLLASDAYWWLTDPGMQSRWVRVALLAAGSWLVLSGAWRGIKNLRARLH